VARAYPFKVGSTLELELYDHDDQVTCKCVVARVVDPGTDEGFAYPAGFGLRIVDCDETGRATLRSMIQRIRDQGDVY
jgi:hypothetical protein